MNCYKKRIALSVPQDGGVEEQREKLAAQGLTDLEHERKSYAIQQVEEFWVSDKSGDCCQIPQRI